MNKLFWTMVVGVFIAAMVLSVVVISIMGARSTGSDALSPEGSHSDLSVSFGSEQANVVVVAFMPIGQECVSATVQTLRQLTGMYPRHLFVAMIDMEAEGQKKSLTFRGHSLSDAAAIRREVGDPELSPAAEASADPAVAPPEKSSEQVFMDVIAKLEKDPPKTAEQLVAENADPNRVPESFCALITINGESRFLLPTETDGEQKDVLFSGPHGTLYSSADLKAAIEATIIRKYGKLPETRMRWGGVKDVMGGREPVPLRSRLP